jgi:hypothetical protein
LTTVEVPTLNSTVRLVVIADLPGIGQAEDTAFAEALGFADGAAAGCRFRLSGPYEGGRRILTVWESRAAFETWRDDRLAAVLQSKGHPVPKFECWDADQAYGL